MFGAPWCGYTQRAIDALRQKKLNFTEFLIQSEETTKFWEPLNKFLRKHGDPHADNHKTFPQVVIFSEHPDHSFTYTVIGSTETLEWCKNAPRSVYM